MWVFSLIWALLKRHPVHTNSLNGYGQMKTEDIKPRGLRAPEAATYVGMGRSKFLQMVKDGLTILWWPTEHQE